MIGCLVKTEGNDGMFFFLNVTHSVSVWAVILSLECR